MSEYVGLQAESRESSVDFFEEQGYKYETTNLQLDHPQRHEATKASHRNVYFLRVISWLKKPDVHHVNSLNPLNCKPQDARACPGHRASLIRALIAANSSSTRALT